MAKSGAFIGFPEGRVREKPVRLPVLENRTDWFALNKFAGLLPQAHPWYQDKVNLTQAIRDQSREGKGELERLGIANCYYVCGPECEFSGPALFAKSKEGADFLKNAYGSDQIRFRYHFVSRNRVEDSHITCDLPVGIHSEEPRAVISHRFGKKARTQFKKLSDSSQFSLWEASSCHPRMHQVRIHAAELGIPVLGDAIYGEELPDPPSVGRKGYKNRPSKPRFSGLALVLLDLDLSRTFKEGPTIDAAPPKPFALLVKKCELSS